MHRGWQRELNRTNHKKVADRTELITFAVQTFRAGDLALTYRPFASTIITVEGERGQYIRRSAPYTARTVLDYQFTRPAGLRLGLSAVWTPDYNLAILNGTIYRDGAGCPIGLYAMYDRKIFGLSRNDAVECRAAACRQARITSDGGPATSAGPTLTGCPIVFTRDRIPTEWIRLRATFRLGVNRVYDLAQGNSKYYKSGANSFNPAAGRPNYIYRYTDPITTNFSATVRF